jgi:hypothetical protein
MQATADPEVGLYYPIPDWNSWATLFWRVEYVAELPPKSEREWAVLYIRPDNRSGSSSLAQGQADELNNIIKGDPGIVVSPKLSLPLTKEHVISNPDEILAIIKQLDREQWDSLYSSLIQAGTIDKYAQRAGIKVSTG